MNKKLDKAIKQALNDCWKYHGKLIKSESNNYCSSKAELYSYFEHLSLQNWEDVAWFVGFIAGLEEANRLIKK